VCSSDLYGDRLVMRVVVALDHRGPDASFLSSNAYTVLGLQTNRLLWSARTPYQQQLDRIKDRLEASKPPPAAPSR
jgi:hypothetical protein